MTLTPSQWHDHRNATYWQTAACTSVALCLALWGISKPISRTKSALFFGALAVAIVARSSHRQHLDHHENISALKQVERAAMAEGKALHYKEFYAIKHQSSLQLTTATLEAQPLIEAAKPELFNWDNLRLQEHWDSYPHVAVIAKTGFGKTYWLSRFLQQVEGKVYVCAIKGKASDWHGHEVFGLGYQFDEIRDVLDLALQIHKSRSTNPNEIHEPIHIVIDDFPSVIRSIKKTHYDDLTLLLRDARSTRIRLWLCLQSDNVKSWGFDGESDLLECFTRIRGGKFAVDEARSLVSRGELEQSDYDWLKGQERPCLVQDRLAEI